MSCPSSHGCRRQGKEWPPKSISAPELLVPTTSHTAALLPAPWGRGQSPVLPQHRVLAPLSPPGSGTPWGHRCAGWGHMHAPTSHHPFSALTKPNNLPEANFSHDAGQEARELHLPAPAGQGASPGHDLYSAQTILGKAGCGLQGVDLSHHHIAQQPQKRFRASTVPGPA